MRKLQKTLAILVASSNFLITGIPFFALGNYIHHKLQKIEKAPYFKNKYLLFGDFN